jgi:hypothetical protein
LVVVVKIRGEITVRVALAVVAEEMIEPVLQRAAARVEHAHAPLADGGGCVAGGLEQLSDGEGALRQRLLALGLDFAVRADRRMARVQPGHQRRAARCADGRAAIGLQVARALARHPVEVRRLDQLLSVHAHVALREIVAEDEDEVGLRRGQATGGSEREPQHREREELGFHGRAIVGRTPRGWRAGKGAGKRLAAFGRAGLSCAHERRDAQGTLRWDSNSA